MRARAGDVSRPSLCHGEGMKLPETIGIIGLGLVGTSLGMVLHQRLHPVRIVGVDIDPKAVALARSRGAIDESAHTPEGLREADLVIVAVPPAAVVEVAEQAAAAMKVDSVLIDVASTKAAIVGGLERALPAHVHYVGGHPMGGSEGQGAASADPALLAGRPFVVTPTPRTDARALDMVKELVERVGMRPVIMTPIEHDDLVAQASHLPYLLAVAVVNAVSDRALTVGGPTLGAFVRIASSPVELWVQIALANRTAIGRALEGVRNELDALERMLSDGSSLRARLARASQRSQAARS